MTTLQATQLAEPELEFGDAGTHVDIRRGLAQFGPLDADLPSRPSSIRVGLVGSPETTEQFQTWLSRCADGLAAKSSPLPNLFPAFPGFGEGRMLATPLTFADRFTRTTTPRQFAKVEKLDTHMKMVSTAVDLFASELQDLSAKGGVDIMVVAPPASLLQAIRDVYRHPSDPLYDLRHMLKARTIGLKAPIQLIRPPTYGGKAMKRRKGYKEQTLQDEATRAWNFYVALYYKAGGLPWRLPRIASDLTTCFVGISFFHDVDRTTVSSSVAQIFNERGDGMIIRGGTPVVSKDDRQLHLNADDAKLLLARSIELYAAEHKTRPARVVVHKTSPFTRDEIDGLDDAAEEAGIHAIDLLHLRESDARMLAAGDYPPPRGTFLTLDDRHSILYTRGVVPYFDTYPGQYIPHPLEIRIAQADSTPVDLAHEILGLTKMNWNNSQFDQGEPMTVRAAREVSNILRYIQPGQQIAQGYAWYM